MLPPLDLTLLRTFVAVVESGGFSDAARLVARSQSAVSMQIQRLEQSLGHSLLVRGPHAARPTAAGIALLPYARKLLLLSDEARAAVSLPEETGVVRLGAPEDYMAYFLPPVLAAFAAQYPLVSIELVCEPTRILTGEIKEGRIDLAVVSCFFDDDPGALRWEPIVWAAAAETLFWPPEPVPIALFDAGCGPAHAHVAEALKASDLAYRIAYSSASLSGLVGVVQAGLAVAALPRCSVPPTLHILEAATDLPPVKGVGMTILQNEAATSKAVETLRAFLSRTLSQDA